ncbi:hypothetical protein NITHO_360005 [Nitrolancea hollandica Lb]|uniref:Uncharacterized protein n=1 Tax=Nitrolancea hollandica Lb TaxID=1129897 RepID=I4EIR2_9BACT|nr:hypothetical protein NITHO_360005 [Nitrolancea hollandica Lb]
MPGERLPDGAAYGMPDHRDVRGHSTDPERGKRDGPWTTRLAGTVEDALPAGPAMSGTRETIVEDDQERIAHRRESSDV